MHHHLFLLRTYRENEIHGQGIADVDLDIAFAGRPERVRAGFDVVEPRRQQRKAVEAAIIAVDGARLTGGLTGKYHGGIGYDCATAVGDGTHQSSSGIALCMERKTGQKVKHYGGKPQNS